MEESEELEKDSPRQLSSSLGSTIEHSPGYHFTAVKEHMMAESEEVEEDPSAVPEQMSRVLYDVTDYIGNGIDSDCSLHDEDAVVIPDGMTERIAAAENTFDDPIRNGDGIVVDTSKKSALGEVYPNSLKLPVLDFTTKRDINPSAAKSFKQAEVQKNEVSLTEPNTSLVDEAPRLTPSSKKGKSKIEALVNIFQDHGIMPVASRGPLHMSSVSPSYSRQTSHYRGESSGTSVGSDTVRKISATLSTGSRCAPSSIHRLGTPCPTFDRPHSRFSDIDTEASFQFGEVLKRTRKHGESETEDLSNRDAAMYG